MTVMEDAAAALREVLSRPFRAAAVRIALLTAALLAAGGAGLHRWLAGLAPPSWGWAATALSLAEGLGLGVGAGFLLPPASARGAGVSGDDLAARVERDLGLPGGRPLPAGRATWLSVRFALLTLAVTALALLLLLVPGVNAVAFLGANAYLSGRQYFEFAALRFRPAGDVEALRQAHAGRVLLYGLAIALLLSVPLLNLLAPLFGTALMVRLHARLGNPRAGRMTATVRRG